MKKIAFLLLWSLILISCRKDNEEFPANPDWLTVMISQMETADYYVGTTVYDWDISMASSDSRVIEAAMNRKEWVSPENTPKSISHKFEYNSKKQLFRKSKEQDSMLQNGV